MKKIRLPFALLILASINTFYAGSQNIGIGTTMPAERLDVNGNINLQGQIKLAGQQGNAGQVLMKNENNNPVWASMGSGFDTIAVFDNLGTTDLLTNWAVPAGVNKIYAEVWGAGGGGGYLFSGGAGGYAAGFFSTSPGDVISLIVGAGGAQATVSANAKNGGSTGIAYNNITVAALGGQGSQMGTGAYPAVPKGGDYYCTSPACFGLSGQAGTGNQYNYGVVSATVYFEEIIFAKGGDSPMYPGSGPLGGYSMIKQPANTAVAKYYGQSNAVTPGYGGAADFTYGYKGGNGRIIIHWKK